MRAGVQEMGRVRPGPPAHALCIKAGERLTREVNGRGMGRAGRRAGSLGNQPGGGQGCRTPLPLGRRGCWQSSRTRAVAQEVT